MKKESTRRGEVLKLTYSRGQMFQKIPQDNNSQMPDPVPVWTHNNDVTMMSLLTLM